MTEETSLRRPMYLYKILPPSAAPPSSLPLALPLSSLDAQDGFIHLSTSYQVLDTLNSFFSSEPFVYIFRLPFSNVAKYIKWEDNRGKTIDKIEECQDLNVAIKFFPHLYANDQDAVGEKGLKLGCDEIDLVAKWKRNKTNWDSHGWPFIEDVPDQ